jgi:hypothetical protein
MDMTDALDVFETILEEKIRGGANVRRLKDTSQPRERAGRL